MGHGGGEQGCVCSSTKLFDRIHCHVRHTLSYTMPPLRLAVQGGLVTSSYLTCGRQHGFLMQLSPCPRAALPAALQEVFTIERFPSVSEVGLKGLNFYMWANLQGSSCQMQLGMLNWNDRSINHELNVHTCAAMLQKELS